MCGILAYLRYEKGSIHKELMERMRDTMFHRGPDDSGIYLDEHVCLAHRRLSIIDLSDKGHQPMENEDGSIYLVFNGEIYNYIELRRELIKKGHVFRSESDSEVIIHQYEEDDEKCLDKLNGMFSLVIWNKNKQEMFAARDRVGIKPLYYYENDKGVVFSSEIKAILEDRDVPRAADKQAIADYHYAGRPLGAKSLFRGIKELEPGCFAKATMGKRPLNVRKYWDVQYLYDYSRKDEALKDELFHLLDDSVKIHCRSDAPLGCHLSGGLDSSTVVALAARHRENLKTFSIKYSDDPHIDETSYAKAVTGHVGAEYHESSPSAEEMANLIPLLIWHMDNPMAVEGGFSYYNVSRLARDSVKVSLTGHGGDELFAGYPSQFQAAYGNADMFSPRPGPVRKERRSIIPKMRKYLAVRRPRVLYRALKKKLMPGRNSFKGEYVRLEYGYEPEDNPIYRNDFIKELAGYSPRDEYVKPFRSVNTDRALDKCLYHDLRVYLPGLLHLEDRVSMALSIESRVPLLDYRIIELLATVPPEQKVRNLTPKHLLREVASSLVPEMVWKRRDKFPFPIPRTLWSMKSMTELTSRVLLSRDCLNRGIYEPRTIREVVRANDTKVLWWLLNVELWHKVFIDLDRYWLEKIASMKKSEGIRCG